MVHCINYQTSSTSYYLLLSRPLQPLKHYIVHITIGSIIQLKYFISLLCKVLRYITVT